MYRVHGADQPMSFHLAQANIALTVAPFSDPRMAGLVERVGEMNALAESSPGFVWRFIAVDGDLTYLQPFAGYYGPDDPERIFFNMSVWESVEALKEYVFHTAHRKMLPGKRQWVLPTAPPHLALWWVPSGHWPSVAEARDRLNRIAQAGPSPEAFTFARPFPPPQ